jgi:hypothetical protein
MVIVDDHMLRLAEDSFWRDEAEDIRPHVWPKKGVVSENASRSAARHGIIGGGS